jgi:hypothetical protein
VVFHQRRPDEERGLRHPRLLHLQPLALYCRPHCLWARYHRQDCTCASLGNPQNYDLRNPQNYALEILLAANTSCN